MADPIKKMDRLRPFKRINNEGAIPTSAPDGNGVQCGCHTPSEIPDMEAAFGRFLQNQPGAGTAFSKIFNAAKEAAKVADQIVSTAKDIAAAVTAAGAALAALSGPAAVVAAPIIALFTAIAAFTKVISAITGFVNEVLDLVDKAIRQFLTRIGGRLAQRAIRRIPQWVPVEDAANRAKITVAQIREVEGIARHSYCDPAGTPFYQWQQWLSWSIQVDPEPAYRNLLVPGFAFARDEGMLGSEKVIVDPATLELQWDMGALRVAGTEPGIYGRKPADSDPNEADLVAREGPFFQSDKTSLQKENHWIWPTAGMYVWASGRWVYDCSRPDSLIKAQPRMFTMLNPLRAMATASWEAFGFEENAPGPVPERNSVPAIRFMFIASRHGGYLNHPSLAEQDYEFILDLPPHPDPPSPFPIGHTHANKRGGDELPDFPHNTIVLRPRLLRDLKTPRPEDNAEVKRITPIIEMLPSPENPGIVRQVKITVKAEQLDGTGPKLAGFLLSLGWFDPNATRAETVRNCSVEFSAVRGRIAKERDDAVKMLRALFKKELDDIKDEITKQIDTKIKISLLPGTSPTSIDDLINNKLPSPVKETVAGIGKMLHDLAHKVVDVVFDKLLELLGDAVNAGADEEWMMHFGVNGRWRTRYLDLKKNKRQDFSTPATVEIKLGPDDLLFHSSGGVQWNPVGTLMLAPKSDRMLKNRDGEVNWSQIATMQGDDLRDLMFHYAFAILVGPGASLILGVENDPLGIRQPEGLDKPGPINPLSPKTALLGEDLPLEPEPTVFARSAGLQEVLAVEDSTVSDYVLSGKAHLAEQFPK